MQSPLTVIMAVIFILMMKLQHFSSSEIRKDPSKSLKEKYTSQTRIKVFSFNLIIIRSNGIMHSNYTNMNLLNCYLFSVYGSGAGITNVCYALTIT